MIDCGVGRQWRWTAHGTPGDVLDVEVPWKVYLGRPELTIMIDHASITPWNLGIDRWWSLGAVLQFLLEIKGHLLNVLFCDRNPAYGTTLIILEPHLDTISMIVVSDITWQRRHKIIFIVCCHTNWALRHLSESFWVPLLTKTQQSCKHIRLSLPYFTVRLILVVSLVHDDGHANQADHPEEDQNHGRKDSDDENYFEVDFQHEVLILTPAGAFFYFTHVHYSVNVYGGP